MMVLLCISTRIQYVIHECLENPVLGRVFKKPRIIGCKNNFSNTETCHLRKTEKEKTLPWTFIKNYSNYSLEYQIGFDYHKFC